MSVHDPRRSVDGFSSSGILHLRVSHYSGNFDMSWGRGLYLAIMGEAKIPLAVIGTVVGLPSVVGYLPDVFMALLMGCF